MLNCNAKNLFINHFLEENQIVFVKIMWLVKSSRKPKEFYGVTLLIFLSSLLKLQQFGWVFFFFKAEYYLVI